MKRRADGTSDYIRHRESTHSRDREFAQRHLNKKLSEIGGRRPQIVDPDEVTYEQLRDAHVAECIAKKQRSVRRGRMHFTRLDRFFGGWRVKDFGVASLSVSARSAAKTASPTRPPTA